MQCYTMPALVPASPWLEADVPAAPRLQLSPVNAGSIKLTMQAGTGSKQVARWAVWLRYGERWEFRVSQRTELQLPASGLDGLVVSAIDRVGNEGPRSALLLPR
jgi:hypothetical protein